MRLHLQVCVLSVFLIQSAHAALKDEIASIDKVMVRACEVAEINAVRARQDLTETFLRTLSLLEGQYRNVGDQDALRACRQARGKYDPKAERVDQPTKTPEPLLALESSMQRQLDSLERNRTKTIADAQNDRHRKLTALQRGLEQRGDKAGAQLVLDALKITPPVPMPPAESAKADAPNPSTSPMAGRSIIPQDVAYLTYARPKKRWVKLEGEGVRREVSAGITTVHYAEGEHGLLKVLWPDVLEVGDRFSVEVKGAFSVELVDLVGEDANARFSLPKADGFVTVEITRQKDQIAFTWNAQQQKTFYASGKLRGDEARAAILSTPLRAAFTVKLDEKASFRYAKIIRP
jgi:hypothetical protein